MRVTDDQLVEREREFEALSGLVEATGKETGRLVLVEAAAGLGKTALLRHAEQLARRQGPRVLSARGRELEREYPFALVGQLLGPLLAAASADERESLLRGAASLALPALQGTGVAGVAGPAPTAPDRDTTSADAQISVEPGDVADPGYASLHGLYWLVSNIAETGPTVLSVDDLHWADVASLRFISFLEARLEGMPLLVICARRPREPGVETDLLDRIGADPAVVRLAPRPLSDAGSARLLKRTFGAVPEPEFVTVCHQACAGNPFYLEVLAAELREAGADPTADEASRVESLVPAVIARTILLRLSRLAPAATELAEAVAVLGDEAAIDVAAELSGLSLDQARAAAEELTRVSLLRRSERLTFVHPIARTAVYRELGPHERSEAHRRAAEHLRLNGAAPEQVASQLFRAAPRGDASAVEQLTEAGRRAAQRGAPEAAVAYLSRALSEPPAESVRPRVLAELGLTEALAAEPVAIEHLSEAVATETEPSRRGEVALSLGRMLLISGRLTEAVDVLESATEQTREAAPELSARLALETEGVRRVVPPAGRMKSLPGIEAVLADDSPVRPLLLWAQAMDASLAGEPTGDLAERGLAEPTLRREEGIASQAFVSLVNMLIYSDRFERAGEVIEEALDVARRVGSVSGFATMSGCRAGLNRRLGRLVDAEADARAALGASEEGAMQILEPMWLADLLDIQVERGGETDGEELLTGRDLAGDFPRPDLGKLFLLCARGRMRTASRDPETGWSDLEACGRGLAVLGVSNPAVIPWRARAAEALLARGEHERAQTLAGEELELARRCGSATAEALALRMCGLASGGDRGIELLREAVATLDSISSTLEGAHAYVDLGATLRRDGHRAEARDPLHSGQQLAESFGARPLAERARTELAAAGARPRTPLRTGLDALTASERRIAEMAAGGQSNPEIAQALFVTRRTVETHLTSAYGKLEIPGRSGLVDALRGGLSVGEASGAASSGRD